MNCAYRIEILIIKTEEYLDFKKYLDFSHSIRGVQKSSEVTKYLRNINSSFECLYCTRYHGAQQILTNATLRHWM